MAKNFQVVLDFLVNLKSDKSQVEKLADEMSSILSKAQPEIKINKEELVSQIELLANFLDELSQSGADVNEVLSNLNVAINDDSALQELENLVSSADDLDSALQGLNLDELSNSINVDDFNAIAESFSNIDTDTLISAFEEAGKSLDEIMVKAGEAVNAQQSALSQMASEGKASTEEYKLLEAELIKTEQLLQNLKNASSSNVFIPKTEGSGEVKITPKIDDSKIPEEAKKTGEKAGEELGKGIKHKFSGMDFKDMFGGILQVFGGSALMSGVSGIVGSFEGLLEAGKESMEGAEYLELGFKQANLSGEALEAQLKRTSKFAGSLSDQFAVSAGTIREYAQQAAFLGGATGKANEDITTLAVVIDKASKGMVNGQAVVRTFSRGLGDPEAQANLGRLKMAFPQLATALKDVENPAEMTKKALDALSPTIATLKEQAQGPIGSMQRLQNSLSAVKTQLGKSLVEAFAPLMIELGNNLIPVLKTVGSSISSVAGFIKEHSSELKTAGIAAGAFATSLWLVNGGLTKLGTSVLSSAKDLLAKLVPSLFAQTAATEGAAVAQGKLNLSFLANPYFLAAAAIAGVVIGLHELTSAFNESAEEKLKDTESQDKLINKQIEAKEKEIELAESKQKLVEEFKNAGESAMENVELMTKLAQAYPGVIDASKSYQENLSALAIASSKTKDDLTKLSGELDTLAQKKIDLQLKISNLKVDVEKQNIEKTLKDAVKIWGLSDATEWVFGTNTAKQWSEQITKPFTDAIYNAKNSKELEKASLDFQTAIFNSKDFERLSAEEKTKMLEGINKMVEARKGAMENANQNAGKDFDVLKESGMQTGQIVDFLAKKYNTTKEEIQGIIEAQEKAKQKVEETKSAVDSLAEAFGKALQESKKKQQEAVGALAEAYAEYQKALKSGDTSEIEKAEKNLKDIRDESHKVYRENKTEELNLTEAEKKAKKELGIQDKEKTKEKKSEYDIALKRFELYKQETRLNSESIDLEKEMSLLSQGRQKNTFDDLSYQERRVQNIQDEKNKFLELFQNIVKINESGELDFKVKLKEEQKQKLSNDWKQLNLDMRKELNKEAELKAKIKLDREEFDKQFAEFKKQQLEFDIQLGIKSPKDMLNLLKGELSSIETSLGDKKVKIESFVAPPTLEDQAQIEALNKDIITLEQKRLAKKKEIQSQEKSIYDEQVKIIKEQQEKEQKAVEDKYTKEEEQLKKFNESWFSGVQKRNETDKNDALQKISNEEKKKLDELQKWQDMGVISKEEYEKKKTQIVDDSRKEREKKDDEFKKKQLRTEAQKQGLDEELQRKKDSDLLKVQKQGIDKQLRLLEQKAKKFDEQGKPIFDSKEDQEAYKNLGKQLDDTEKMIKEKGDTLGIITKDMQTTVTDSLSNLFAGDPEAAANSWRKFFGQLAGMLQAKASAFILDLILSPGTMEYLGALPFPANVIAVPIITGVIYTAVKAITDPIISAILSFSTGGRVDQPTMALIGDASRLGSRNREWIFNDSQLQATVQMASVGSNAMLIAKLDRVE